jgi:hypothetical protein
MRMSRMGYRKGTPDVLFFEPRGVYHGFLVEFKTPHGTVSPEQYKFISEAKDRGYVAVVCRSTNEAIEALRFYLRAADFVTAGPSV